MSKKQENPTVSESEWQIMDILWDEGPMATRDLYAILSDRKSWAISTVKTLLLRLVNKGVVQYDQIGNSYLYRAVVSRDEITRQEMRHFINRVFGGSLSPFWAHFVEDESLTDEELDEMQRAVRKQLEKRKESDGRPDGEC